MAGTCEEVIAHPQGRVSHFSALLAGGPRYQENFEGRDFHMLNYNPYVKATEYPSRITTGVLNFSELEQWLFDEEGIDLDYEAWLEEHDPNSDPCRWGYP